MEGKIRPPFDLFGFYVNNSERYQCLLLEAFSWEASPNRHALMFALS